MTPEERQLITGLFDRMRNLGSVEKDRDAEALINDRVRAAPDAPYMLVQSVLVQEQALQQAEGRIRDLEDQVRDLESSSQARSPASSGSFLGGLFGSGRPAAQPGNTSVPPIGSRAADFPPPSRDRPASGPFAGPYDAPPPQAAAGGGGGFMRSAMTTAAGVAGGMLAAGAIRDLMGGSAHASTATPAAAAAPAAPAASKENAASGTDATNQQASTADAGNTNTQTVRDEQGDKGSDNTNDNYQDAYDDSSGDWDDGGDFEV